jgi:ribosomal protein L7/L12/DNA-directed RNA polymerase subunit RPC12/RpoP
MTNTFNCPMCGAPLDYPGHEETIRCPYCHNTVIVPPEIRGNQPKAVSQSTVDGVLTAQQIAEILGFLRAGKKINAIKVYREATLAGLAEAKQAVEAMEAADAGLPSSSTQVSGNGELTPEQLADIRRLLAEGNKIEAIKVYRQATRLGLKQAKDAVEAIQATDPELRKMAPNASAKNSKVAALLVALFFFGIASIFPLVFIPMGMDAWQMGEFGGAIGSYFAAAVWAIIWGGIGALILFS